MREKEQTWLMLGGDENRKIYIISYILIYN